MDYTGMADTPTKAQTDYASISKYMLDNEYFTVRRNTIKAVAKRFKLTEDQAKAAMYRILNGWIGSSTVDVVAVSDDVIDRIR